MHYILYGACYRPMAQTDGGHQARCYCNDACKQVAYRRRQEEKTARGHAPTLVEL